MTSIAMIPADNNGNFLFIKDFRREEQRMFLYYRSTFNTIPFRETEVFASDGGKNIIITGEDGTVLYRFSTAWLSKIE
jgi:hypothetical protein